MDGHTFDRWTATLARRWGRRETMRGLFAGGWIAGSMLAPSASALAKHHRHHHQRHHPCRALGAGCDGKHHCCQDPDPLECEAVPACVDPPAKYCCGLTGATCTHGCDCCHGLGCAKRLGELTGACQPA